MLPDEIVRYLLHNSTGAFCVWAKAPPKKLLQHRIDRLKQKLSSNSPFKIQRRRQRLKRILKSEFERSYFVKCTRTYLELNSLEKYASSERERKFLLGSFKVARYAFSGSIPPKFEHKLRRHEKRFGKIATTVVLDKDKDLL